MKLSNYNGIPHLKHGNFTIALDEHAYAAVIANIIRAKQCIYKHDIQEYYDRDHWTMLLLYYTRALKVFKMACPDTFKSISLADYNDLVEIYNTKDIICKGITICHSTCLDSDIDILEYTIMAATAVQTILEHEFTYKPETITKLVGYNIEASDREYNENYKKKYTK